jgi:hypothetical protein
MAPAEVSIQIIRGIGFLERTGGENRRLEGQEKPPAKGSRTIP